MKLPNSKLRNARLSEVTGPGNYLSKRTANVLKAAMSKYTFADNIAVSHVFGALTLAEMSRAKGMGRLAFREVCELFEAAYLKTK